MKNNIKTQKGITLIALVITIVVMLILAGISINLIIGENGIFTKTKEAREKFEVASVKEQIGQDLLSADMYLSKNNNKITNGQLAATLEKYGTVVYGTGENINKVEGVTIQDETTINIADIWSGTQEVSWDINGENKKVTPVLDTEGIAVPIPMGFYYVGGKIDTGVVISDVEADKYDGITDKTAHSYNTSLEGNQFVWVPVTGGIENARSDFGTNKNWVANYGTCIDVLAQDYVPGGTIITESTDVAYNAKSIVLENQITVNLYKEMQISVNNYEGFYVARYEASCMQLNNLAAGSSFTSTDAINEGIAESKANGKPWDSIGQLDAMTKCKAMYATSQGENDRKHESVKSLLMSSYTWDATLSFIQNRGDKKDVAEDSNLWGNYKNRRPANNKTIIFNGYNINDDVWANVNSFSGVWSSLNNIENYAIYLKLATGIAESSKANNIYDLAGNIGEWTTEVSGDGAASNRVHRGGNFDHDLNGREWFTASYRVGGTRSAACANSVGFRPQLFIQMQPEIP